MPSSLKKESDLEKFSWPILIGKIFKLSKLLFDCKSSRDGISSLQGAHQDAQKSNNITLDSTSLKETGSANKSGPVNSGAKLPIDGVSLSFLIFPSTSFGSNKILLK